MPITLPQLNTWEQEVSYWKNKCKEQQDALEALQAELELSGKVSKKLAEHALAAGAAPTKEPVAWMREDSQWVTDSKSVMEHHKEKGMKFTPLYK